MLHSIQWKLIFIYLVLILIAMMVIGVYLLDSLERYYLDDHKEGMKSQSQLVGTLLRRHMIEDDMDKDYMSSLLNELGKQTEDEITLLDQNGRVITTTGENGEAEGTLILEQEITGALSGNLSTDIRIDPSNDHRKKFMAMPITEGQQVLGVVYSTSSLEKVDITMEQIRTTLLTGTFIAMIITAILVYLLAKTITDPVKELTSTAKSMAQGDFQKKIDIKGNDEIGNLGKMFNYMALRLDNTLKEISSEKGKLEGILNQMTDGVVVIDEKYRVVHINPAAQQMLGICADELRNEISEELITRFISLEQFNNAMDYEKDEKIESFITSESDQSIKAQIVPYRSQAEGEKGIIVVLNDITEEEELLQMKQEFIENASHELRTPLTSIKSYVETLLDGAIEDKPIARRFLKVIENETSRMVSMVKDLLVLSKLDKREEIVEFEEVEINDLVKRSVESIEERARGKGLKIYQDFFPGRLVTIGDSNKITQVIINILENAVKYTPDGGYIKVNTSLDDREVKITVEDSGIGIPDNELSSIFDRFYRVDKDRSREKGGTGLGLAISREIVKSHGGKIKASSKEGVGTTVELVFPINDNKLELTGNAGKN